MALGFTEVNFVELEQAIAQLKTIKENLNAQLRSAKGEIDNSVNNPEIYLSQDARVTKEQFEEMYNRWAQKFDGYVQEYIDYFNRAKELYEQRAATETSVAQSLNQFID